jgi:hypothetical protein
VFWATAGEWHKHKLDGSALWSLPIRVQRFELDYAGKRSIVQRAGDTRRVELYDEQSLIGQSTFDRPLYNLAIAPLGQYAAANSKTILRLFHGGKTVAQVQLGSVYPVSMDVADDGWMLVGIQDRRARASYVRMYDAKGVLKWSKTLPDERQAYRPEVRFTPDGKGFFVREKSTLSFYTREVP